MGCESHGVESQSKTWKCWSLKPVQRKRGHGVPKKEEENLPRTGKLYAGERRGVSLGRVVILKEQNSLPRKGREASHLGIGL